jgi:alpha-amylase/alpha-mannosidase (GH57 family)
MAHDKYVCIHGHFYQPPRENPWLNTIEVQDSAYPFHDWNDRITSECYSRNAAARILGEQGRIEDIVNNYSRISFNFGPTLLQWMKNKAPEVYYSILDADRKSQELFSGHGSAIAQAYNHTIVPLSNARDQETQILWGIRDFEYRFERKPEGMWLPETAVNTETLEVLATHDIKFTILSPYQAKRVRKKGTKEWADAMGAKVDPRRPYTCNLPSGKKITLFFYDGPVSQGIAFEGLLNDGEAFGNRLVDQLDSQEDNPEPQLMHIATDGESYGHHHRYGEMGLAYCLHHIEERPGVDISIYGEFLEKYPPQYEAEVIENTAWSSTPHLERWSEDGGGNTGGRPDWNQQWRKPLRAAFDWLRDKLAAVYEQEMATFVDDPWATRNHYVRVIFDRSHDNVADFIYQQTGKSLSHAEEVKFLKLLEIQHHAMLMYTSCGWFFDEVTGIETVQDILYAARAIQLHRDITGDDLEAAFIEHLAKAPSNLPEYGNAAVAYERLVRPSIVDMNRVGAHFAVSSLFSEYTQQDRVYSFGVDLQHFEKHYAGKYRLALGKASLTSEVTWEKEDVTFAVIHLGEHHLFGGVRASLEEEAYEAMRDEIVEAFQKSRVHEAVVLMDKHFGMHNYSFWHLFKEDQKELLNKVLEETMNNVEGTFRQIYENNYSVLQAMKQLSIQAPRPLKDAGEFTINSKLRRMLEHDHIERAELDAMVESIDNLDVDIDSVGLSYLAGERINTLMEQVEQHPNDLAYMERAVQFIQACFQVHLQPDLWRAQNVAFIIHRENFVQMSRKQDRGEEHATRWLNTFAQLFEVLNIRVNDYASVPQV